jgi:hypothetical protein
MARAITANFPESIKVGLHEVFYSRLSDIEKEFRQWANVITGPNPGGEAGKAYLEDLRIASLGTFAPKPEGDVIMYDVPKEGELVRATPYAFALGFRMTHEMKSDARYGVFDRMTEELSGAAMHQMEVQAHRLLNNGFGTTGGTGHTAAGFDSLSLFSTSHTLLNAGATTGANRATTDLDLSVTALELATDAMEGTVNESGFPTARHPTVLVIPYQLKWIAKELTESELKPYTGDNEVNPLRGEGFRYMISHYLTDADSWFLLDVKDRHGLNVWIRETPIFETGDDFDTGDTKAKGYFRMATWHNDWRGVFGSTGA